MKSKLQIEVEKVEDRHANSNRFPGSICEANPNELRHLRSIALKKSPKYKQPKRKPRATTLFIRKNGLSLKQILNHLGLTYYQMNYYLHYQYDHAWKLIEKAVREIKDGQK